MITGGSKFEKIQKSKSRNGREEELPKQKIKQKKHDKSMYRLRKREEENAT
jgi:hypothetical protein